MSFGDTLARAVAARQSHVVVGLDPDPRKVGDDPDAVRRFCLGVIAAAGPACVAVKPQSAYFERLGAAGWDVMWDVSQAARDAGLVVILDAKRGDIDVSAAAYAQALLRDPVDALTVNPMMGGDAVRPFTMHARERDKGVFALVRTSNPGAGDLEDLVLDDGRPWHEAVAGLVALIGEASVGESGLSGVGAVVGATAPQHLGRLRDLMPHQPFLIPGVGAQGGRPEDLGPAFARHRAGAVVNASRSIIFAPDPRKAAEDLRATLWTLAERSAPS